MRTELYRHYDADDVLLYVGISLSTIERLSGHRSSSHWFNKIEKITIERFKSRAAAEAAEKAAIKEEKPKFNIVHNEDKPEKRKSGRRLDDIEVIIKRIIVLGRIPNIQYHRGESPSKEAFDAWESSSLKVKKAALKQVLEWYYTGLKRSDSDEIRILSFYEFSERMFSVLMPNTLIEWRDKTDKYFILPPLSEIRGRFNILTDNELGPKDPSKKEV